MNALLDSSNDRMRRRFYSGLWYQPPYTDHFENYFGIDSVEARRLFCYRESPEQVLTGPLKNKTWWDTCSGGGGGFNPICFAGLEHDSSLPRWWNTLQGIRRQFIDCVGKSMALPPIQPPQKWTAPTCVYKKFDGYFHLGGQAEIDAMKNEGYSVSVQHENQCLDPNFIQFIDSAEIVNISGYKCN